MNATLKGAFQGIYEKQYTKKNGEPGRQEQIILFAPDRYGDQVRDQWFAINVKPEVARKLQLELEQDDVLKVEVYLFGRRAQRNDGTMGYFNELAYYRHEIVRRNG